MSSNKSIYCLKEKRMKSIVQIFCVPYALRLNVTLLNVSNQKLKQTGNYLWNLMFYFYTSTSLRKVTSHCNILRKTLFYLMQHISQVQMFALEDTTSVSFQPISLFFFFRRSDPLLPQVCVPLSRKVNNI